MIKASGKKSDNSAAHPADASADPVISQQDASAAAKIDALPDALLRQCGTLICAGTDIFRLQYGAYCGSSVFFNHNGAAGRYNLTNGETGTMYGAMTPLTALKEVFQNTIALTESDLHEYRMGIVRIEQACSVFEIRQLMTRSSVTLHDVTTSRRTVTQKLARKIYAAGFTGIRFPSNVTGDECLALWHSDASGAGMVTTRAQIRLSEFMLDGREIADILVDDLNIAVEEG